MKKTIALLISGIIVVVSCKTNYEDVPVRVATFKGDKIAAISYTFDDGMSEHYSHAAPELEKHGFRGTFWINGNSINEDNDIRNEERATWGQLKEMAQNGHEISNHAWSHPNLTKISREEVIREIEKNDSIIYAGTGFKSVTFCYPFNAYNDEVLALASKNRVLTRTKQKGIGTKSTPEDLNQWVDELLTKKEWGVAMIHGINYGYDAFGDSQILWEHFEKVKRLKDKVWVGTFREVGAYCAERESFIWEVNPVKNGIKITPHLSLDRSLFNEPLTLVLEKEGVHKIEITQDNQKLTPQIYDTKVTFDINPYGGVIHVSF